jgi:hypothetical protein
MPRLLALVMVVLALSLPRMAQAHFIWIETQPTARVRLQAQGPNGWIKEMRPSDSWGVTSFVPLWPGRYVIALERDEPSVGELQGRKYDTISQRVTFSFLVEASR